MYLSRWKLYDALPNDSISDTGMKETLHREGGHQGVGAGLVPLQAAWGNGYRGARVKQTSAQTPRSPRTSCVALGHFPHLSKWQCLLTLL